LKDNIWRNSHIERLSNVTPDKALSLIEYVLDLRLTLILPQPGEKDPRE